MNTTQLKDFALLAEASYAHFEEIDYGNNQLSQNRLSTYESMNNGTFTAKQAELFTSDYTLLHQSEEGVISGFSATVFRDDANPNRLVLSVRGTEFEGDIIKDLILTDLTGIGGYGYAIQQALPLYRYIRQLQTDGGQPVNYTEEEMEKMYALSIGNIITSTVLENTPAFTAFKASLAFDVGIGNLGEPALFNPGMEIARVGRTRLRYAV